MSEAKIASRQPYAVDVEEGKDYWWCACGRSARQPFCDGSHRDTEFTPKKFTAERSEKVWLCGCKRTRNQPFCDGTHNRLPESA